MEWNDISRGLMPDPKLYPSFKKSAKGKKLAMWLKLSNAEKEAWNFDINSWADGYVRQHPGAFMPSLYNTLRAYMKEISDQMGMQEQSGEDKKEWRKIFDKGVRDLAYIISHKLFNEDVTDDVYLATIQQSFIYYKGNQLQEECKLTEKQIKMLNSIEESGDTNYAIYNKDVYKPYVKPLVAKYEERPQNKHLAIPTTFLRSSS
jgi:hypothetical protein